LVSPQIDNQDQEKIAKGIEEQVFKQVTDNNFPIGENVTFRIILVGR